MNIKTSEKMLKTQLPDKQKWAKQLRMLAKAGSITQLDLAEKLDCAPVTVKRIFDGTRSFEQMAELEQAIIDLVEKSEVGADA